MSKLHYSMIDITGMFDRKEAATTWGDFYQLNLKEINVVVVQRISYYID